MGSRHDFEIRNIPKVVAVVRDQRQIMFQSGGGDQQVKWPIANVISGVLRDVNPDRSASFSHV